MNFINPRGKLEIIDISANSLVTWLFSKKQVSGCVQRLLKIIFHDTE
jgi:hypothetical protein